MRMTAKRFEIIESMCATGKASADANEDRLVVTDDFVAVIDGSTSSGPLDGRAGGIVAAETVADVIRSLPALATAPEFVALATARLSERIGSWPENVARPSAASVLWSAARREIWRVGDCHFRIDDSEHNGDKPLDALAYGYRCAVVRARLALGLTTIEREQKIPVLQQPFAALIETQHIFTNLAADDPLGYGALDGRPVPAKYIEVFSAGDAREIVLCSDGLRTPTRRWPRGSRRSPS
jgi:hypothetical protein